MEGSVFAINSRIGSEILRIFEIERMPQAEVGSSTSEIKQFPPFVIFEGRRTAQARQIDEAWKGHGFEISFEYLPEKTMIFQSSYTGQSLPGLCDCLRLGIGHYLLCSGADAL